MQDKKRSTIYSKYYQLGCKVAEDTYNQQISSTVNRAAKNLDSVGKIYKKHKDTLSTKVDEYTKKLPSIAQKALPKNLVDSAISNIELLNVADKMTSPEGRAKLQKDYTFIPPEKDNLKNMAVDIKKSLLSSPLSISGTSARARTLNRSLKGAKKTEKSRVQTATELNEALANKDKDKAQQKRESIRVQTEVQPRFNSFLAL